LIYGDYCFHAFISFRFSPGCLHLDAPIIVNSCRYICGGISRFGCRSHHSASEYRYTIIFWCKKLCNLTVSYIRKISICCPPLRLKFLKKRNVQTPVRICVALLSALGTACNGSAKKEKVIDHPKLIKTIGSPKYGNVRDDQNVEIAHVLIFLLIILDPVTPRIAAEENDLQWLVAVRGNVNISKQEQLPFLHP
jgi:hypothetical protein